MSIYRELTVAGTPTRSAAELTGISRATATRKARARFPVMEPVAQPVPANTIDPTERAGVLAVLNSDRFVNQAPLQVYAQLLDEGTYLCSVPTMYRVLVEARWVKERRRLARHPAGVPALVPTAACQVYSGISPSWPARSRACTTTPT